MTSRFHRVCAAIFLAGTSQVAALADCGPAFTDYFHSNRDSVFWFKGPKEDNCTAAPIIYGRLLHGQVDAEILNECSGQVDDFYVGPTGDALAQLGAICGKAWLGYYFFKDQGPVGMIPAIRHALTSTALPTGQASENLTLDDVNGDTFIDRLRLSSNGLVVDLRAADGSTLSSKSFPVGFTPTAVNSQLATGDFNRDGKLDVAVSYYGNTSTNLGGAVFILLGRGDGTFGAPVTVNAGQNPGSLAAADFNGDGKLDLAVANLNSLNFSILAGNGDGTFAAPVSYATGQNLTGSPRSLLAVDLNGDGASDIAVAYGNRVAVLLNTHSGFGQPSNTPLSYSPDYLAYGDLNHDGKLDLAVAGLNNAIILLFGNGDGTFQTPAAYASGNGPGSLSVLPLTDGVTLLLTVDQLTGLVWVMQLASDGTSGAPRLNPVPGRPTGMAVGDLNGDGAPDVVVTGMTNDVSVLVAKGSQFLPLQAYSLAGNGSSPQPENVAIADLNGDGKPDIATANATGSVSVMLGNGDGTFKSPLKTTVNQNAQSLVAGDFDRDGKLDLAVAAFGGGSDTGGVVILRGKGDGTFQLPATLSAGSGRPVYITTADFNGDGKLDLAAITIAADHSILPAGLAVFLGRGDGTFNSIVPMTLKLKAFAFPSIAAGDVNGDGVPDIVVTTDQGGADVLLGNGNGSFREFAQPATETELTGLTLTDVDGDGKLDIVVLGNSGAYLPGNGDGTFQAESPLASGAAVAVAAIKPSTPISTAGLFFANGNGTVTAIHTVKPAITLTISANVSAANANLSTLSPGSIATAYGANLATDTAQAAGFPPLTLAGTTVTIHDAAGVDRPAPLFYVSSGQVNYEVPEDTATGSATVTIQASSGITGSLATPIATLAPGIFQLNAGGLVAAIVLTIGADNAQIFSNVYQLASQNIVPFPVDLSGGAVYLELYGTGLRGAKTVTVTIGGQNVPVLSSGAQGIDPGLDQVNVGPLPTTLKGAGQVSVVLKADGQTANTTAIAIK